MKQIKINRDLMLRDDGKLIKIKTNEEFIPHINSGYYRISHFGKPKYVHVLVMELFGPPRPETNYEVDHINRNRLDNRIENLRWVTREQNVYNKTNNLPVGERKCDVSLTKYKTLAWYKWKNKQIKNKNPGD